MALLSHKTEPFGKGRLDNWESIGSGGFGHVYKARHKDSGKTVAIKILRDGVCPVKASLCEEANFMEKAACEFVLKVYGIYQICPPVGEKHMQQGIVMEFMERGSVQSMLNDLSGPPPWPLAFRLAHQVAQGMSILHSLKLMHHDLKPSNVLLNEDLNAKLADFGLSRVSASALTSNREINEEIGGSYKYMPPEAFEASYKPVRAFDRYSYGILLWSIITGEEPYPHADYTLVALRIPEGDRPSCKEIDQTKADGLKEIVDLMNRCWDKNPSNRPTFEECCAVTQDVLSKHKDGISRAVHQVLTKLMPPAGIQHSNTNLTPEQSKSNDTVDNIPKTETFSIQDIDVSAKKMNDENKAKFVDNKRAVLIQEVSEVMALAEELGDMVHSETYSVIAAKETSQEKMRVLYERTFRSGGVMVKAAFYDALKKHHPSIIERLGDSF